MGADQTAPQIRVHSVFFHSKNIIINHMGLNMSGFLKKRDSNQSPQLQRLARKLKFCL